MSEYARVLVCFVKCNDISGIYVTAQMCRRNEDAIDIDENKDLRTPGVSLRPVSVLGRAR